jgi:hypothetical protein
MEMKGNCLDKAYGPQEGARVPFQAFCNHRIMFDGTLEDLIRPGIVQGLVESGGNFCLGFVFYYFYG